MKNFKRTADSFVEGSKTLDARYFISNDIFTLERENIFSRTWMCVGHISSLPTPGDYFTREILGENIVVLLDRTNTVRAYYNFCRHLGTRLCMNENGHTGGSIVCDYHLWTYRLTDGTLISAKHMDGVTGFKKEENGLLAVPVHIWEGFIFVWMGKAEPTPFGEIYEEVLGKLSDWGVSGLVEGHREVVLARANWKLIVENFNECLHCPSIHPTLNKHLSYTDAENDLDEGTCLGGFMNIVGGESMTMTGELCALPLGEMNARTTGKGWYYSLFPTLLINAHPDYLMYHMLFPISAGETLIISVWLFHPLSAEQPGYKPLEAVKIWDETNREDWKICERTQLGLQSSRRTPGFYSKQQSLLAAFDREYLRWID